MSLFTSRKIRFEILAIYLSIFLVSIVGITYYSYTRSNEAVIKVADNLIAKTNDGIANELDQFIQPTPLFSIAKLILNDSHLDEHDLQTLSRYMHVLLESYPQLVNAYIADNDGDLFLENHVRKLPLSQQLIPFIKDLTVPDHTNYISVMMLASNGQENMRFVFKDKLGNVISKTNAVVKGFNPLTRPWYMHAKDNGKLVWIGIYNFYDSNEQVITTAFPVYSGNQFMGVAAADISLTSLRHAIQKYSLEAKGIVFIASHTGKVISSEEYTADSEKGGNVSTIEANKNNIIKTAYWQFIQGKENHFIFMLEGVNYIAQFKTYAISGDEKWEIATIIPLDNFVGSINHAIRNTLVFALLTLVLGLGLVVLFANRISKPIIRMAEETQDMQHFDFSKATKIKSHIYEIQTMVTALNIAKSALYSFSKYVPKLLVDQLLSMGNIAEPGGEKKVITILFSDIVNFSRIAESTDPNLVMQQLSEYFDVLTKCIHAHQGNIDKYIGDAMMAFWGAPQEDVNQVRNACLALLECRREVHRLNKEWRKSGRPVFATRFGLNTGTAIIGNLGSSDRINYTAIGETVNLAARLEEVNKGYGTEIVVSEAVFKACNRQFLFRPVDIVWVEGKSDAVIIYQLVAELSNSSDHAATQGQIELCKMFKRAFEFYHAKRYAIALEEFVLIAEKFPKDTLTQLYIKRCQNQLY